MFKRLDDQVQVAAQISAADVAVAAGLGVRTIINNRPDGEEPGQPEGEHIEAAARAVGIDYVAIPVTHAGFSHGQLDATARALGAAEGQVLAYCRSGTRSAHLWALTRAREGGDPETLSAQAAKAGYNLSALRPMLDALAGDR